MTGDDGTRSADADAGTCHAGSCGCRNGAGGGSEAVAGPGRGPAGEARGTAGGVDSGALGEAPSGGTSRRRFLKVLGLSGAGAAAAGCGPPDYGDKLIPYLVQHEEIVPGTNTVYAGALVDEGPEPLGIHAWVREGRILKLEGNPEAPTNRGRLSALAQSALQALYDPDRVRTPLRRAAEAGGDAPEGEDDDPRAAYGEAEWEEAVSALGSAVAEGGLVLMTPAGTGTADRFFREWAEATGAEHVPYEPFDLAALREAHRIAFGVDALPSFRLAEADRIVGFGADFLGTWLAPVELADGFSRAREVAGGRFAKFTFVGPRLNLTGTSADEWVAARSGTEGLVALAVANVVAERRGVSGLGEAVARATPESVAEAAGVEAGEIRRLGEELAEADAPVALPPGHAAREGRAVEAHLAVALLNQALGAVGSTVRFDDPPLRGRSASLAELSDLVGRMRAGEVRTLVAVGVNPAFTLPAAVGFREALGSVERSFALSPHFDETAAACGWVLPCHHGLESWTDARVRPGAWLLGQPAMRPVFETRSREDILMRAAPGSDFGAPDWAGYLQAAWRELHAASGRGGDFGTWWRDALRRGGAFDLPAGAGGGGAGTAGAGAGEGGGGAAAPALTEEARSATFSPAPAADGTALVVYPSVQFYDGRGANRSWMQELPDPVTKNVWNSWVEMHPEAAERLGVEHGDVVEVTSEAGSVRAPIHVYPGVRPDTIAIPVGQGHTAYGRYARGRGVNPLDLLPARPEERTGALTLAGVAVEVSPTGERALLVNAQGSDSDYGREVAELRNVEEVRETLEGHDPAAGGFVRAAYDADPESPYRWGMSVDVNACIGCGACVTACYAENNIPTVGEDRFAAGREMSWLRVERFYEETEEGFQTVHLPMLCQHCGDAPCEPVCPVYATYHTGEGLNAQVYNRCVGTRYCSNNCPYKVRRFNWFTYDFPHPLNLQLNPDVTVREKGVMEKCTFCVQRINRARETAKDEGRFVEDGEFQTACQQTCPTHAITFGNLKDPESEVSRKARRADGYHVLGELGTRPAVTYLEDVTHAHPVGDAHGAGGVETPHEGGPEPAHGAGGDAASGEGH